MGTFTERRKHQRFKTKEGVFVVGNSQLGIVRDISLGGISFKYINGSPGTSSAIDIFSVDSSLHLIEVPFRPTMDNKENFGPQYSTIVAKNCAGEFISLSPDQQQKLEFFLHNLGADS